MSRKVDYFDNINELFFRYEWKKNGFELNTNLSSIRKGSDGTVTVDTATVKDEGYYQCFATNQYGTTLSNVLDVRMIFTEPTAGSPTVHQKVVVEGRPFHIQPDRQRSLQKPTYDWCISVGVNAQNFVRLDLSNRIQRASNGNTELCIHFHTTKYVTALLSDTQERLILRQFQRTLKFMKSILT